MGVSRALRKLPPLRARNVRLSPLLSGPRAQRSLIIARTRFGEAQEHECGPTAIKPGWVFLANSVYALARRADEPALVPYAAAPTGHTNRH